MKKIITVLLVCLAFQWSAQSQMTAEKWQEDLRFLQSTIHTNYSFLFKKVSASKFDTEVDKLYEEIPTLEDHEVVVGLSRIISLFKYGHTDIGFRQEPFTFHELPLNLYQYSDGVYLQGVHKDHEIALGAKVIAIGETPIDVALKAIYPTVPTENDQYFKAFGINYLKFPEVLHAQRVIPNYTKTVEFTLEKNGRQFKHSFTTLPPGERVPVTYSHVLQQGDWLDVRDQTKTPLYLKDLEKNFVSEYLADSKTMYVRHSKVRDGEEETIKAFFGNVFTFIENNPVDRMILDLRLNGGGNNYKNKAIIKGILASKKINVEGRLYVILGRRTFSAAQNLVNEIDNYTNVIFVGEPTAENVNFYGDTRQVVLPNSKVPTYLSFAWWQDKPQWENADWTLPDFPVEMSFEQYKNNEDPVLDKALNFNGEGFIINPMEYYTELFEQGNLAKLRQEVATMIKDDRYAAFPFENEFDQAGTNLLRSGQTQGALYVFEMIVEFFPNSARAFDSLARAYIKAGEIEKAKTALHEVIRIDAGGSLAKIAKSTLEGLNK